jgi:hypothetical protein
MNHEVRLYRVSGKNKVRIAKIKNSNSIGFFGWIRLYFILKKYSVKG